MGIVDISPLFQDSSLSVSTVSTRYEVIEPNVAGEVPHVFPPPVGVTIKSYTTTIRVKAYLAPLHVILNPVP